MKPSKFYAMTVKIKNKITLFTLFAKTPPYIPSQKLGLPFASK